MLDLEPPRQLPPEIYRRRRAAAIGAAVLVLAVVVTLIAVVVNTVGGSSEPQPVALDAPPAPPAAITNAPQLPIDPEVPTPFVPPALELPPPVPTETAAVTPPPVLESGDDCPDSTLAVKGLTSEPRYVVGDQPTFTMVVTNIGLVACQRDIGAAVLSAYVYALDNNRLWSNLDCAPSSETLVRTFEPGEQLTTEVTWTGMGSAAGCPLPREPIGPGTYNLVVQLGNLRSAALPFILADPAAPGPVDGPADAAPTEETTAPVA